MLKDLIVREQFLAVCEEHLAIYLRERDPRKISDVVKLADTYLDAQLHPDGKDKKGKNVYQSKACSRGHAREWKEFSRCGV